ncbi:MAG: pyridine nucleotide-disulfide oxidoreductase [Thermodesulfobacteriota bacterium]|nr:MAG: pyridine nucleotide-disulfide oxidoreductase [Thermodesulfobacteriota bacterium]
MSEKIVIVGAVAAGPKAACRARRLMPDAQITIVDQDDLISYGGCGIPYFVSGDVADEKELRSTTFNMVRDAYYFKQAKGFEVRTMTKALSIDLKQKFLHVEDVRTTEKDSIPYDKLMLATGSRPNVLPIPGNDLDGIFTISSLHKAIAIKDCLAKGRVGKAVVIGGGAIGIEMAEAMADLWGAETTIVEFMPQILPRIVDQTIASMVEQHLKKNGVTVYTKETARKFEGDDQGNVCKVITDKREIEADLVIMAVGVRPRGELAKNAGLLVSSQGGIVVNQRMQTSDPSIYAAGDCVETCNLISGKKAYAPMGSIANRQGRVVADNLAGIPSTFNGVVGSFIMKVFDLSVGATGLSLDVAKAEGFDAISALCAQYDRAHFFPTKENMFLNMVVDRSDKRVLGLQGMGAMGDGLMARINAVAGLLEKKAVISDFSNLELPYAPPFSTAVDILNATANVADNTVSGRFRAIDVKDFVAWLNGEESHPDWLAIDLRHPAEATHFIEKFQDRWRHMPYDKFRDEHEQLPKDKMLILICNAGAKAYEVQCFLDSVNIKNTVVLPGGLNVIRNLGVDWWPS